MDTSRNISLLDRIEILLQEHCISKYKLCKDLNFSSHIFNNWDKPGYTPNADTVLKIADKLNVSVEWLLTGKIDLPDDYNKQPFEIYKRIELLLLKKANNPNQDYVRNHIEQIYAPILSEVEWSDIRNWKANRAYPKVDTLLFIAKRLNSCIEYLIDGNPSTSPNEHVEKISVSASEYQDFLRFQEYKYFLYAYDCMYDPDKKYISQLVQRLFRLRRVAEKQDYDYDYMREHPDEPDRMLDPNISDEEYAEMRKKKDQIW